MKITLNNSNKIYLITFAGGGQNYYDSANRLLQQAKEFNIFDETFGYTELDLKNDNYFWEKHKKFILANKHGYGNFIWKPYLIYKKLSHIKENDILVYLDAGVHLNIKGKNRLHQYFEYLKNKDMLCFKTSEKYKGIGYVKKDAIMFYNPDYLNNNDASCYAGLIIIKKTSQTLELIKDWLKLCENYNFLNTNPSIEYKDHEQYCGNDLDNGLFNLTLSKYKNILHIVDNECNVLINEIQIHHLNFNFNNNVWSILDNFPFHNKRDR